MTATDDVVPPTELTTVRMIREVLAVARATQGMDPSTSGAAAAAVTLGDFVCLLAQQVPSVAAKIEVMNDSGDGDSRGTMLFALKAIMATHKLTAPAVFDEVSKLFHDLGVGEIADGLEAAVPTSGFVDQMVDGSRIHGIGDPPRLDADESDDPADDFWDRAAAYAQEALADVGLEITDDRAKAFVRKYDDLVAENLG